VDDRPLTVIVVDDADDVRKVIGVALEGSGRFTVVGEGASGPEAIDLARDHQPDLVLLDVSMAGMDGIEAIPAIRAAAPRTRVVMLSGFAAPDLEDHARALGAADFIEKQQRVELLPNRLLAVFGADPVDAVEGADPGANEILSEHLERFRALFDRATIGMATLTLAGRVVRANRALARIAGTDERALVGRAFPELAPEPARSALGDVFGDVARGPRDVVDLEHQLVRSETMWVRSTISAVRDPSGHALYLFVQLEDVTERRIAAQEREQAAAALEEANRRLERTAEEKSEFLAVTAHELRSPVVAMSSGADMLRRHWDQLAGDDRAELLDTIVAAGARLRRLIDDLLTVSRIEEGALSYTIERFALLPLLRETVASLPEAGNVTVTCAPGVEAVADRGRVGQIVTNLLVNALTYGQPPIEISGEATGSWTELRIVDHGAGPPHDLVPRLFQKFARFTGERGTGLGLFIVRELARANGGDAWYEATPAGRTTFAVRVPCEGPSGQAEQSSSAQTTLPPPA
jgi:PAS domain S-box-containing protein